MSSITSQEASNLSVLCQKVNRLNTESINALERVRQNNLPELLAFITVRQLASNLSPIVFNEELVSGKNISLENDGALIVTEPGIYSVSFVASIADLDSAFFNFTVLVNGVSVPGLIITSITNAQSVINGINGLLQLNSGDRVTIEPDRAPGDDPNYNNATLTLHYVNEIP